MNEIWASIKRYKKTYIVLLAISGTIIIVNETLDFIDKLWGNTMLILFSLVVFYFFAIITLEEVKNA